MKNVCLILGVTALLFMISCASTSHNPGPVMSEDKGQVEWVFPDNKKYGVIRMGDNKWFPYYDELDILRWDDIIYNLPQYGNGSTHINVEKSNNSTNIYLYEHKLTRHRAVSYIRMITTLGENDSDRGF